MEIQLSWATWTSRREQLFGFADGDLVRVGVDGEHVERVGAGEAEALALADGEVVDAGMAADDLTGACDELAGGFGHGLLLLVEVGAEEGLVVAAGDEADLLRIGLGGDLEAGVRGHDAHGGLLHFAEREEGVGELVLGETEEEVGLVFAAVGGAGEDPAIARGVEVVARVVAGGDAGGADLACGEQELIELEVVVAERARNGGAAGEILGDEGADDVLLEALLLVDEVVGDAEAVGDAACVVDVVDGAAAALDLTRACLRGRRGGAGSKAAA